MWEGINKRKFPRAKYQCLLTLGGKGGNKHFLAYTENIGIGGVGLVLDEDVGRFSEVDIELILRDEDTPIQCKGNAVWIIKRTQVKGSQLVPKFDTGIEFLDIKEKDKARIAKIVEQLIQGQLKQ